MIDDNNLIQAFATSFAGILIFLTLERRFEAKEEYDRNSRIRSEEQDAAEERKRTVSDEGYEAAKENLKRIEKKTETAKMNFRGKLLAYKSLKIIESVITIVMIGLIAASIVIMLPHTYLDDVTKRSISSLIFTIGITLLILRVCLHGKRI